MIEKIGTLGFETLSRPDKTVLEYLEKIILINPNPIFYEIGVGVGATTLPVAEMMNNKGTIYLFSRINDVCELASDLRARGYVNIDSTWGSASKIYSGYHFELARGYAERLLPQFDLAYIDGGHVFHLDAPAACILKELCRSGGYMIFDDYNWSLAKSPTMNPSKRPATSAEYDDLQIKTCHVRLVCQTIMDSDQRFKFLGLNGNTAIYQKINDFS
jgi:SAM-dependent methyltransferase